MNAYATATRGYKESAVLTAPPGRLVVMLYDGAHRFLFQSATAMRAGDVAKSGERMSRAEAIIDELLSTLDMSAGEVAERLQALYLFSKRTLLEARLETDADKIDQVSEVLGELREAWTQIAG
jgi:flagellar secretion chaperone FliS